MTSKPGCDIISKLTSSAYVFGSIAQLGEHLPYKQRVIGSSPIVSIIGPVVQLVRTLACHARGHEFESRPGRFIWLTSYADLAHLVERNLAKVEVAGPSPVIRLKTVVNYSVFFVRVGDARRTLERSMARAFKLKKI